MSETTGIQWTEATWNPVTGCSKVSAGCKNCYAERIWPRVYGKFRPFSDVKLHRDRLDLPHQWKKPRRIFVNSMSDLFHESLSHNDITEVWSVMVVVDRHIYQVLTKRPARMREYVIGWIEHMRSGSKRPVDNVWLGVSAEDQRSLDERLSILRETPAAVRWLSLEPLLGPVTFRPICDSLGDKLHAMENGYAAKPMELQGISWVVVGGESGPKARPFNPDWARYIRDQCREAGVPFFMKQFGSNPVAGKLKDGHGGNMDEWPEDLRVRDYPSGT